MRVALYENLHSGGSKREAFEFARALTAHGHVVDLWTTTAGDATFLPMHQVTCQQFCYGWPQPRPLPRHLPGLRGYLGAAEFVDRLRRIVQVARHMAADIDRAGYDFVFAHHCQPVQGPYLLRFLRTPSIYYCNEPLRPAYDPPLDRPYDRPEGVVARPAGGWAGPTPTAQPPIRKR